MLKRYSDHLEIILKVAERCNINCSYCYFFNGQDKTYKEHPPFISLDTVKEILKFINQGVKDLNIKAISIDYHGGEPLLLKKSLFDSICNTFKEGLPSSVQLKLNMQSNGMLITPEWISLLKKYEVRLGISLDGPEDINDQARIDFRQRGTYSSVLKGLKLVQESDHNVGILCVINPKNSAKKIYRHFVDKLKIKRMDFLLPDVTYDIIEYAEGKAYGEYLCDLFEEWFKDNNPNIIVRILNSTVSLLLGQDSYFLTQEINKKKPIIITIGSDGSLFHDDTLRSTGEEKLRDNYSVKNISLREFVNSPSTQLISHAVETLPEVCKSCKWQIICRGGELIHRYKKANMFDNPSVLCEGLKLYYNYVASTMVNAGIPAQELKIC